MLSYAAGVLQVYKVDQIIIKEFLYWAKTTNSRSCTLAQVKNISISILTEWKSNVQTYK